MSYVKQSSDKGIKLRIGTDWSNGGKAIASEQLLLSEYGFTIPAILQISTINAQRRWDWTIGMVRWRQEKRPIFLIWDQSPFDNYKNFLSRKTIIKDGIVFAGSKKRAD